MASAIFPLTARRMRKWSEVKASRSPRYRASTPMTPANPSSGTASAERKVLNFDGSFKYPGSTDGFPLMIGLRFCATQPDKPCPTGMRSEESIVIAIHIFGHQFIVASHIDCNRVIRHHRLELHREYRQGLAQAQRCAKVLAQFEQCLRFLACRGD